MGNRDYNIPFAYVFCQENVEVRERVIYLPIYMTAFLEQIQVEDNLYKFDLKGLV
jgi:hypothetical protein